MISTHKEFLSRYLTVWCNVCSDRESARSEYERAFLSAHFEFVGIPVSAAPKSTSWPIMVVVPDEN
ncbi:hypothetical protein HMPREF9120_00044 [Neisseria sp. oral taxon 020 str. F0370]|nr:hypothetical protein HMPREF9120_00044 [Neisseria sp. oral taxon 020 str. F0370]